MNLPKKLLSAAVLTLGFSFVAAAHAQLAPYAMFSASHYSGIGVGVGTTATESGGITPLGGTFGLQDDVLHTGPLALGWDARGIVQNSANSTPYGDKLAAFLVGGRLAANAIVLPFRPYGQLEIGAVATNNGTQTNKSTGFAYQFQFGGDFTILPHLGARLEYGAGQVTSNSINHTLQTFGAGLVIRL
jgi:hypothetical protein